MTDQSSNRINTSKEAPQPRRQFMDFAPRRLSTTAKHSAPSPRPDAQTRPDTISRSGAPVRPAAKPPARTVTHITAVSSRETTIIVPKAPAEKPASRPTRPVIKSHDEPTPVTVKTETSIFSSKPAKNRAEDPAVVEVAGEDESPRRPERHGIIAQLEESSAFGLFESDVVDSTPKAPKSVFINTDKVDKRPLGSTDSSAPKKNLYKKNAPKPIKDNVPTVVVSNPDKKNSVTLIIAALLTIVLGGIVGTFIYLAFFQ